MKTKIVRIGNSNGIRLPKPILEQCRLIDAVELEIQDDRLVIRPIHSTRSGWERAFAEMAKKGGDTLLQPDPRNTEWDKNEWRW